MKDHNAKYSELMEKLKIVDTAIDTKVFREKCLDLIEKYKEREKELTVKYGSYHSVHDDNIRNFIEYVIDDKKEDIEGIILNFVSTDEHSAAFSA